MRLKEVSVENFRGYKEKIHIEFNDLTTFVGKNDIGKSTILEALDIFFNEGSGIIKLDKDDINKECLAVDNKDIVITAIFDELPNEIIIDSTYSTTLESEYMLNESSKLEIIKKYPNAGKEKVFISAMHPTNENCSNLLEKTKTQLNKIINDNGIECDNRTINAVMRKSIWEFYKEDIALEKKELEINKGDTKEIWQKLKNYLPCYSLFQSDRKNSDGDSEVQDPLKSAVKQILQDPSLNQKLSEVASEVEGKLREVSERTLDKLNEMSPEVAETLKPVIPPNDSLKWNDVFKNVSIASDENIPINKRGSGVKRLILLNFFRAEAERKLAEESSESVIYAIEEPETSQHTDNQLKLIKAFKELANSPNTQVIMTTHSANIVKNLEFENLKLITEGETGKIVNSVSLNRLPYPSLNEVNYLAFNEITEEYHNELYGFIDAEEKLNQFKEGKSRMSYTKQFRNREPRIEQITLTEYVRHQIHHPENNLNERFTFEQLENSINMMRTFINSDISDE